MVEMTDSDTRRRKEWLIANMPPHLGTDMYSFLQVLTAMEAESQHWHEPARVDSKGDWTAQGTVSNSSNKYHRIVKVVEDLIRGSAHDLIAGDAHGVAGLIVSNLAHKHGMAIKGDGR